MDIGKCQLCLQQAQLVAKSHIIPFFLIKKLKDHTNRFIVTKTNERGKHKWKQNFFYEKNILCSSCENELISSFERYFSIFDDGLHARISKGLDLTEPLLQPPNFQMAHIGSYFQKPILSGY